MWRNGAGPENEETILRSGIPMIGLQVILNQAQTRFDSR
jgi:hypothetical protein